MSLSPSPPPPTPLKATSSPHEPMSTPLASSRSLIQVHARPEVLKCPAARQCVLLTIDPSRTSMYMTQNEISNDTREMRYLCCMCARGEEGGFGDVSA